jgi:hypothetical protein
MSFDLYTKLFHIINDSLSKPDLFVFFYTIALKDCKKHKKKEGEAMNKIYQMTI